MKIKISLPSNRDVCGFLEVTGEDEIRILGPVPVAGRAHDTAAAQHQNAGRTPLLPYGNTPCGSYSVRGLIRSQNVELGPHPVIRLSPLAGDAALADANGRFHCAIHGDDPARQDALRATCGTLRIFNSDQEALVALLAAGDGVVECTVEETGAAEGPEVWRGGNPPQLLDPLSFHATRESAFSQKPGSDTLTRREALAKAAIITIAGSSIFVAQGQRAEGQVTQYSTPAPQPTPDLNDQRAPDLQDIHVSPPPASTPEPEQATPEPATPEPATHEPATPEPATPEPATPEPQLRDAPNDQATATPRPTLAPLNKYGSVTVTNNTNPPEPIRFLVDGGTQTTVQAGSTGTASSIPYGEHTVTAYIYGSNGSNEGNKVCEQPVTIDDDNVDARITCP